MSARMDLHVALSLRLDAIEAYRLANAYRAEVLAEAADVALAVPTPDCAEMSSLTNAFEEGQWVAVKAIRALITSPAGQPGKDTREGESTRAIPPHEDPSLPPQLREALRIMAKRGPVVELTAPFAAATPDFFQPGHTYTVAQWEFRCDTVTTHPETGDRTALGWTRIGISPWTTYSHTEADWAEGSWAEAPAGGEPRG